MVCQIVLEDDQGSVPRTADWAALVRPLKYTHLDGRAFTAHGKDAQRRRVYRTTEPRPIPEDLLCIELWTQDGGLIKRLFVCEAKRRLRFEGRWYKRWQADATGAIYLQEPSTYYRWRHPKPCHAS